MKRATVEEDEEELLSDEVEDKAEAGVANRGVKKQLSVTSVISLDISSTSAKQIMLIWRNQKRWC
jgi:hypothetical protein